MGKATITHIPPFEEKYLTWALLYLPITRVSALCRGKGGSQRPIDPSVLFDFTPTNISGSANVVSGNDKNFLYHDFRHFRNDTRPTWYFQQMRYLRANYKKGEIGYTKSHLKTLAEKESQYIGVINGVVYDFTDYMIGGRITRDKDDFPSAAHCVTIWKSASTTSSKSEP
ncbi:chitin synthase 6 [Coccidioides immitis H538.4]|uniref:Chitin synthase 6 n=1 Tax=Coccidioides immitis H538.4 TaxID=396776 RepID=A0A0J8RLJ0_COCIT|nr:chitin synthase 6 [Coccidioides immitis H538.4]